MLPLVVLLLDWVPAPANIPAGIDRRVRSDRARGSASSSQEAQFMIGAAGDITCGSAPYPDTASDSCQDDDTAELLTGLDHVLTLGDNQYPTGSHEAYLAYYGARWGEFRDRTSPVPGNHEYGDDPAATPVGYFAYFGDRVKGPDGLGYYGFDLPRGCTPGAEVCWHVVALNSELCFASEGCGPSDGNGPGSRMYRWLERDLAIIRTAGTRARSRSGIIRCSHSPVRAGGPRRCDPCGSSCTRPGSTSC